MITPMSILNKCGRTLGSYLTVTCLWILMITTIILAIPLGVAYVIFLTIFVAILGTLSALFGPRKNCKVRIP